MTARPGENRAGLSVARELIDFVEGELLPRTGVDPRRFWSGLADILAELGDRGRALVAERDELQARIDQWLQDEPDAHRDPSTHRRFLESIGYLLPRPTQVQVTTSDVDPEICELSGPQLVVPVTNARYALNAVNARWGSLYDAVYGTDVLPGPRTARGYDRERGARVVRYVREFLDESFALENGTHSDAVAYEVADGALAVHLGDGSVSRLQRGDAFVGYTGAAPSPEVIVLRHHGLHVWIEIDRSSSVGASDPAGISDVRLESALTTIVDLEDSVATVDAEDKVAAYRNWLLLNTGELQATFDKGGRPITRRMVSDLAVTAADGEGTVDLPGRSLMFVRNVGHLTTTDAVLDSDGRPVGEGILDAVITVFAALPGRRADNPFRNGTRGSIYIVKPKMHGPAEAAYARDILERVEQLADLPPRTIKIGVMDEERRTTLNLEATLAQVSDRVVFINTGFLDRSGDEIHTAMEAGPIVRKASMRSQRWIRAYETHNVDVGLRIGMDGHGQIGKGMWAMPDLMADMMTEKIAQPLAAASTAWVPSPTAATLHAMHYHRVDVAARRAAIRGGEATAVEELLVLPVDPLAAWSDEDRRREVDTNVQSLLGYVVRWVELGVGASKVPDLDGVGLMEDRATVRISSQLLANWIHHGVVAEGDVRESMLRMAAVVDRQNADEPGYVPMSADPQSSLAFAAAEELVFRGREQPNGYTEPVLHRYRRLAKAR